MKPAMAKTADGGLIWFEDLACNDRVIVSAVDCLIMQGWSTRTKQMLWSNKGFTAPHDDNNGSHPCLWVQINCS